MVEIVVLAVMRVCDLLWVLWRCAMVWCFRWRDHICGLSHGCGYGTDGGLSFWVRQGPRACLGLFCLLSCVGHTQCHSLVKIIVIPLLWSFLSIVARSTSTFLCWSHKFGQQENKTGLKILIPKFNQEKSGSMRRNSEFLCSVSGSHSNLSLAQLRVNWSKLWYSVFDARSTSNQPELIFVATGGREIFCLATYFFRNNAKLFVI